MPGYGVGVGTIGFRRRSRALPPAVKMVKVVNPLADQTLIQGNGNATMDLGTVFANATSYSVTGDGATIDGDGITLRLDDIVVRSGVTITVTGTGPGGSAEDVFVLNVTPAQTEPEQMAAPSLAVESAEKITATLSADPPDGGAAITSYDLRYSSDQATWTTLDSIASPAEIPGLAPDTEYHVQSRAVNAVGVGAWSLSARAVTLSAPSSPPIQAFSVGLQTRENIPLALDMANDVATPVTAYIVAVPAGASAPSATQVEAGTDANDIPAPIGASYTTSADGVTNITLGDLRTGRYDFYATAIDGNSVSWGDTISDIGIALNFDPILSDPTAAANGSDGATSLGVTTTDKSGMLFWGVYPTAATPTAAEIATGTGATVSGSQVVAAQGVQSISNQTGLTEETTYKAYFVQEDPAGNWSNVVASPGFITDAASGMADPNDLGTKLRWWADFTDVGTLYQDTGGTPITANGQPVRSITNKKSGARTEYLQVTAAGQDPVWDAAKGQVSLNFGPNGAFINPPGETYFANLGPSFEVYFAIRTTDTQFMLMCDNVGANAFVGTVQSGNGLAPSNSMGTPTHTTNGTPVASETRGGLSTEWSTGSALVAGVQSINGANWANRQVRLFNYGSGYPFAGEVTHVIVTQDALTAQERTDLQNWLSTRLPT